MATRLDWEKAKRREQKRRRPDKRTREQNDARRRVMLEFVKKHGLSCFGCDARVDVDWAKTGFSKRGPWAICTGCVKRKKRP